MGIIDLLYLLPGFEVFVTSPWALGFYEMGTALVLFLGLIGWRTRWTLPLGAAAYLVFAGLFRHYAWFYHTGLVPLYLLAVLAFLPAGDGFSVDRLRRLWRGTAGPSAHVATRRYGWARYAVWTALALPYVAAGFSKLRNGGPLWWDAVNFKYILFYSALRPMEFSFDGGLLLTSAPDLLFEAMALAAILGEMFYGLVLVSKWGRWIMPTVMLGMHVGILFLQDILFFDLILLQVIFFNLRPLRLALGRRLNARWGSLTVVCNRTTSLGASLARVLPALDFLNRLQLVDLQNDEAKSTSTSGALDSRTAPALQVATGGTLRYDPAALRRLARAVPLLWGTLPLLYVPGLAALVARRMTGATASAHDGAAASGAPTTRSGFASPRLTLALMGLLLTCWTFHVEVYPLTGMQMFSHVRGPVVTYELMHAHLEDGSTVRAPLESSIGALADARFRRALSMAFDPDRAHVTEALMDSVITRWNDKTPPARAIRTIEVERWRWNYEADPDDPTHGDLVGRRRYGPDAPTRPTPTAADPPGSATPASSPR
jgi:hypothetical protein